jgi:hypothetical protein
LYNLSDIDLIYEYVKANPINIFELYKNMPAVERAAVKNAIDIGRGERVEEVKQCTIDPSFFVLWLNLWSRVDQITFKQNDQSPKAVITYGANKIFGLEGTIANDDRIIWNNHKNETGFLFLGLLVRFAMVRRY